MLKFCFFFFFLRAFFHSNPRRAPRGRQVLGYLAYTSQCLRVEGLRNKSVGLRDNGIRVLMLRGLRNKGFRL